MVGVSSIAGTAFGIVCGVGLVASFVWLWWNRDRRTESELGPVVFSEEVRVKFRRGSKRPYSFVTRTFGWPRLLVHNGTIAIRAPGVPEWLGATMMMNYTLDAADCEIDVARIYRSHPLVPTRDEYVVLRTTDNRGWLEIGLRPRRVSLEDLQHELIGAGVQPAAKVIEG